jgi:hypothetical protein
MLGLDVGSSARHINEQPCTMSIMSAAWLYFSKSITIGLRLRAWLEGDCNSVLLVVLFQGISLSTLRIATALKDIVLTR